MQAVDVIGSATSTSFSRVILIFVKQVYNLKLTKNMNDNKLCGRKWGFFSSSMVGLKKQNLIKTALGNQELLGRYFKGILVSEILYN